MPDLDDSKVLVGMGGWEDAQTIFLGVGNPIQPYFLIECGWHDTSVDDNEGAFCMAQAGSALEDMVGSVVKVSYKNQAIFVYCVGTAVLATPISLQRAAFLRLEQLSESVISVVAQETA